MLQYHLHVTTFEPIPRVEQSVFEDPDDIAAAIAHLGNVNTVIVVHALSESADHGSFYLFLNEHGLAHVMLVDAQGDVFPVDPLPVAGGEKVFHGEDGYPFAVADSQVTTVLRAKTALDHWLPSQERWPEFEWPRKS